MNAYIIAKLSIPYFYKVFLDFKIDFLIKDIKKCKVNDCSFGNLYASRDSSFANSELCPKKWTINSQIKRVLRNY